MEFFAGAGRATKSFSFGGYSTARLDIMYMKSRGGAQNPMDLTSDAGLANLNTMLVSCTFCVYVQPLFQQMRDWATKGKPRTAIATILRGNVKDGWVCHFGLKCSSWTQINSGTSNRSPCCAIGNLAFTSVLEANMLASRLHELFKTMFLFSSGCSMRLSDTHSV